MERVQRLQTAAVVGPCTELPEACNAVRMSTANVVHNSDRADYQTDGPPSFGRSHEDN